MFITFEGIEGCGKTTQLRLLAEALEKQGYQVVRTREPGGSPIAEKIRDILLDAENRALVPRSELLLYAAARAQHVDEVVAPALAAGKVVLCDRFTDATEAYQGNGRNLDPKTIQTLNALACGNVRPAMTILIDCDVETGLGRAKSRIAACSGPAEDRFEQECLQFHEKVRQGYLAIARREPERVTVIPGNVSVEETAAAVIAAVTKRMHGGS